MMFSCREVTELSTEHLERGLPFGRRAAMRLHLMMCRHCRAYLRQLRKLAAVLRVLGRRPPPAEERDRVLSGVEADRR